MAELARGTVADRPWGMTFGALGMRGLTGQLTLAADGKLFCVAFERGAIVGATSPLLSDAAVRVALTGGLVSSTQAADISRRLAADATRDELDVIAEHVRLAPEQAQRLRRRVVAQRAARTFSIERGEFVVEDRITVPVLPGCELDIRAVVYLGARQNLTEARLDSDLTRLGAWFQVKPDAVPDLQQYGFTETEKPVLEMLIDGANLVELETAHAEVDVRGVRAIVYALVSCGACEIGAQPRGNPRSPRMPTPPPIARSGPTRTTVTPPQGARTVTRSTPPVGTAVSRTHSTTTGEHRRAGIDITPIPTRGSASSPPPAGKRASTAPPHSAPPPAARPATSPPASTSPTTASSLATTPEPRPKPATTKPPASRESPSGRRSPSEISPAGDDVVRIRPTSGAPPLAMAPMTEARAQRHSSLPPTVRPRKNDTATLDTEALIAEKSALVDSGGDHFALLGVPRDASPDTIRTTYFALARKLHPDRLASLGIADVKREAQRVFAQINAAFAMLADSARHDDYLAVLARGGEAAVRAEDAKADEIASKIMRAEEAFRRGEMAMRRDQVAQAVTEFATAVELQPGEGEYQVLLAWARFAAAPDKPAVAAATRATLQKAADASDKTVTARFYLGRVERMLGREKEALGHFQYVVTIKPNHAEASAEVRVLESRIKGKR